MKCIATIDPEMIREELQLFLRKRERVLICFPENTGTEGPAFSGAITSCGAINVFWDNDFLWKTLLRQAFSERCGTIIGSPAIILGLGKLAKRMGTPLYIRNVVIVGKKTDDWMIETIQEALDARVRFCCYTAEEREDGVVTQLTHELRRWTTILDYRLDRSGAGLSLEMVVFPGEKLPKLPSFAKLVVKSWNPEADTPFDVPIEWRSDAFCSKNH